MIVTIDSNLTTYEFGKNCIVKIRKIYRDGLYRYLFEYGKRNQLAPDFSVWSFDLPSYYARLVDLAFNHIGFDRNFDERDITGLVSSIRNYLKRKNYAKN